MSLVSRIKGAFQVLFGPSSVVVTKEEKKENVGSTPSVETPTREEPVTPIGYTRAGNRIVYKTKVTEEYIILTLRVGAEWFKVKIEPNYYYEVGATEDFINRNQTAIAALIGRVEAVIDDSMGAEDDLRYLSLLRTIVLTSLSFSTKRYVLDLVVDEADYISEILQGSEEILRKADSFNYNRFGAELLEEVEGLKDELDPDRDKTVDLYDLYVNLEGLIGVDGISTPSEFLVATNRDEYSTFITREEDLTPNFDEIVNIFSNIEEIDAMGDPYGELTLSDIITLLEGDIFNDVVAGEGKFLTYLGTLQVNDFDIEDEDGFSIKEIHEVIVHLYRNSPDLMNDLFELVNELELDSENIEFEHKTGIEYE